MKHGVITDLGPNFGTIACKDDTKYKFALSSYPKADFGQCVTFDEDTDNSTIHTRYAIDLKSVGSESAAVIDLLARVKALEVMIARTTSNDDLVRIIEEDRDFGGNGSGVV